VMVCSYHCRTQFESTYFTYLREAVEHLQKIMATIRWYRFKRHGYKAQTDYLLQQEIKFKDWVITRRNLQTCLTICFLWSSLQSESNCNHMHNSGKWQRPKPARNLLNLLWINSCFQKRKHTAKHSMTSV